MKKLKPQTSGFIGKSLYLKRDGSFSVSTQRQVPEEFDIGTKISGNSFLPTSFGSFYAEYNPTYSTQLGSFTYIRNYYDGEYLGSVNDSPSIVEPVYTFEGTTSLGWYDQFVERENGIFLYAKNTFYRIEEGELVFEVDVDKGTSVQQQGFFLKDCAMIFSRVSGDTVIDVYSYEDGSLLATETVASSTFEPESWIIGDNRIWASSESTTTYIIYWENNTLSVDDYPTYGPTQDGWDHPDTAWFTKTELKHIQPVDDGVLLADYIYRAAVKYDKDMNMVWVNDVDFTDSTFVMTIYNPFNGNLLLYDWGVPQVLEISGETGEILRSYVDPVYEYPTRGCMLNENTAVWLDDVGDSTDVVWFDLNEWEITKRQNIAINFGGSESYAMPQYSASSLAMFGRILITENEAFLKPVTSGFTTGVLHPCPTNSGVLYYANYNGQHGVFKVS